MKTIYIDLDYKCHTENDGTMTQIETDFFDGKCDAYIEGYRFVPYGHIWKRPDGTEFEGEMIAAWKKTSELNELQSCYEKDLLRQYEAELMELDMALLEAQYQNLTGGM